MKQIERAVSHSPLQL